jgi:hypothetical protein
MLTKKKLTFKRHKMASNYDVHSHPGTYFFFFFAAMKIIVLYFHNYYDISFSFSLHHTIVN